MTLQVLSLGAGVQSTTLLLMSCRGDLPKLDAAIFCDTGWVPPEVYEHLAWLEEYATRHGVPVHRTGAPTLRKDAISLQVRGTFPGGPRWVSMPLYTRQPGATAVGRTQRQCSQEYKIAPFDRFVRCELLGLQYRHRAPAGAVDKWLGISADEMRRIRQSKRAWVRNVYPLVGIPDVMLPRPFSRPACIAWIKEHFPGREVPRSACIGCPFHSNREWRWIKSRPDLWADAVEFDQAIRRRGGIRGDMFLHRSGVPLTEANLDEDQSEMWGDECLGVCGN